MKPTLALQKEEGDGVFSLFTGECGHRWVGAKMGSWGCPVCGVHDGDHNIVTCDPIAMQYDDWGLVDTKRFGWR